jgi:signal transduction histidine kinase
LGGRIEIRIRDNGNGIPAEIRDRILNPFFTMKPTGQGTISSFSSITGRFWQQQLFFRCW